MKLVRTAAIIIGIMVFANPLYAEGEFEMGMELSSFEYEEPNFMEEDGFLYGFFGSYTHRSHENQPVSSFGEIFSGDNSMNVFELDARIAFGDMDYTSVGTGSLSEVDEFIFEIRGLAGYDLPVYTDSRITPYFGFAYRYLNDDSGGRTTTTGALGYERESNYFYIPIGVEFATQFESSWSMSATVEYDIFVYGKQESHLEDAISGLSTVENDQEGGYGVRGSIKFKKETERIDFFVEPYIRYWKVDDSEISPITFNGVLVGFGLEPENKSLESGARVGISF